MRTYEFMLTLHTEPDLDTIDRLYAFFDAAGGAPAGVEDFTLITSAATPIVDCTIKATSFDDALQLVLPRLSQEGLRVVGVEVNEAGLALLQEAM